MRVITGKARGRKLSAPDGYEVRPTTDKVKEAIFSIIQFDIEGACVLDLFSGSGQMGIEALSREASNAVFVDKSKDSISVINKNIDTTDFFDVSKVYHMDSLDYLKRTDLCFDIVFVDPPYNKGLVLSSLELLSDKVNSSGKVICEHESNLDLPDKFENLIFKKSYKYGKTNISIYVKDFEEE